MDGLAWRVVISVNCLGPLLAALSACAEPKDGESSATMDADGGSMRDAGTSEVEPTKRPDAGIPAEEPVVPAAPEAARDAGPDAAPQPAAQPSRPPEPEPTTPWRDAAALPPVPELFVDYFMQPCGVSKLCLRVSSDGRTWRTDTPLEWDGFEWGHRYRLRFHDTGPDGSVAVVVDEVLQDDAVEAGTRFSLTLAATATDAGPSSFVTIAGSDHGWLGDEGRFECRPELCAAVDEALSALRSVELGFEFDAETAMHLVAVADSGIDDGDVARLAAEWASTQPSEYVVRVCTTGATPYSCKLASVAAGAVVEALERGADTAWANATFTQSPIDDVFDFTFAGFREPSSDCRTSYVAAEDYPYIEEVSTLCDQATSGLQVTCFVPGSLDLSDCSA